MLQFIKNPLRNAFVRVGGAVGERSLGRFGGKHLDEVAALNKQNQIMLGLRYKEMARNGSPLPVFDEVQFRSFSQNGEDGILLYIFSIIGTTDKKCVEICAGDGIECNTANLIVNHGWIGLLVDGDEKLVRRGREFYSRHPDTFTWAPSFRCSWITRDSVNSIIHEAGVGGEIDLLSLDLDGMDYWIWEAIDAIDPRVVVLEYQDICGPDRAITVPYSDDFQAKMCTKLGPNYGGASLKAFVQLAAKRGYRLVGVERYGFNAFFIKRGLGEAEFPEIPVAACFDHPKVVNGMKVRWPTVAGMEWVEV